MHCTSTDTLLLNCSVRVYLNADSNEQYRTRISIKRSYSYSYIDQTIILVLVYRSNDHTRIHEHDWLISLVEITVSLLFSTSQCSAWTPRCTSTRTQSSDRTCYFKSAIGPSSMKCAFTRLLLCTTTTLHTTTITYYCTTLRICTDWKYCILEWIIAILLDASPQLCPRTCSTAVLLHLLKNHRLRMS